MVLEDKFENTYLPMRQPGETDEQYYGRRVEVYEELRARKPPLVFRQGHDAKFVDGLEKLLFN
jgi:hypothetical protein